MLTRCGRSSLRLFCAAPLIILNSETHLATSFLVPSSTTLSKPSSFPLRHQTRSIHCNLFFRSGERNTTPSVRKRRLLDPEIVKELESPTLSLPYSMTVSDNENIDSETTETLTIRCMELGDLDEVIKMCIDEFGSGPSVGPGDFPWSRPQSIPEWWDRVYFEPSVRMALKAKLRNNSRMSRKKKDIIESRVEDPAILVLCREQGKKASVDVVGLVEISLQPPEADKNPPTYPNPLGLKEFYSRLKGLKLQGWVTNLLVDPECRGLGYSKLLMLATEGVARSWNRDYIYLHADADYKSGRIPQSLYEGMGYEVVADEDPEYKWMPKSTFSSIQMVEGVPLLFFRKRL